ncbi:MAG TPA: PEP-CTERM sorting domain-containing protein [Verrucomicrobiae bacterium]|nr:PEP-CTERM sorting domain-containing protein [Verrucomicrobiae bacterium]
MVKVLVSVSVGLWLLGQDATSAQATISANSVADAFVRSADPTHNYGGAGALSVSGTIATNANGVQHGVFDSFLRFDISSTVAQFNADFGVGGWTISGANLLLTETAAPANAIFNRGVGQFEVRWIANDSWIEGTGNPNSPNTSGIVYNDEPSVLNAGPDTTLGLFANGGTNGLDTFSLSTPSAFLDDINAGGLVSFYLTATADSTVGFTFNSHEFGTASQRPQLQLTAVAVPEPSALILVGLSMAALIVLRRAQRKCGHAPTN